MMSIFTDIFGIITSQGGIRYVSITVRSGSLDTITNIKKLTSN